MLSSPLNSDCCRVCVNKMTRQQLVCLLLTLSHSPDDDEVSLMSNNFWCCSSHIPGQITFGSSFHKECFYPNFLTSCELTVSLCVKNRFPTRLIIWFSLPRYHSLTLFGMAIIEFFCTNYILEASKSLQDFHPDSLIIRQSCCRSKACQKEVIKLTHS